MSNPRTRNRVSPADIVSAGDFGSKVSGQFLNNQRQPKTVRAPSYLGVEKPTSRGKRVVESINSIGDGETS